MRHMVCYLAACLVLASCATANKPQHKVTNANYQSMVKVPNGMPAINDNSAIYEVAVKDGVSYQDVVDSLKSISEGMNFVNPANFPIGDHMKQRGQSPLGVLEVRAFCNLGLGAEIMQDHPEFVVFAPCRIALYEKLNSQKTLQLFLALDRPTFDLQSIHKPTARAIQAAVDLETALIDMLAKARNGDF